MLEKNAGKKKNACGNRGARGQKRFHAFFRQNVSSIFLPAFFAHQNIGAAKSTPTFQNRNLSCFETNVDLQHALATTAGT